MIFKLDIETESQREIKNALYKVIDELEDLLHRNVTSMDLKDDSGVTIGRVNIQ